MDLANPAESALLRFVRACNSGAQAFTADHGWIDSAPVFNSGLYDPQTKSVDVSVWLAAEGHGHVPARHSADIKAFTIVRQEPICAVVLTLFLEARLEHCGTDILRLKGIVNVAESPQRLQ